MWHRIVLEVRTESMEGELAENDKRMAELEGEIKAVAGGTAGQTVLRPLPAQPGTAACTMHNVNRNSIQGCHMMSSCTLQLP